MKRYLSIWIIFGILLISLTNIPTIYARQVEIETDDLLVRSGPGTSYEPIGHVSSGQVFTYLDQEDEWISIDYHSETGWISAQFASITTEQENWEEKPSSDEDAQTDGNEGSVFTTIIPVDVVNLRSEPSTNGDIVTEIPIGEMISFSVMNDSDWIYVTWGDYTGYMPSWILGDEMQFIEVQDSIFKGKVIVIDPGHGGIDVGAISAAGYYESDYAMITSEFLRDTLEKLGATVYMTRENDYYYSLSPRASLANLHLADVFLSIHYNSTPQYPSANGMNTFYRESNDRALAGYVHNSLIETTRANDRGYDSGDYSVLRTGSRPGLLLELGFISNVEEEENIQSHQYQRKMTEGIIHGLRRYFSQR